MTNRERVIAALEFDRPDRTPYTLSLTGQMLQKMIGYTGRADYMETVGNHISDVYLIKPERTIKPDFVQDEFGVVWNRSGVDKDIGVIDHPLIGCPGDLDSYQTVSYTHLDVYKRQALGKDGKAKARAVHDGIIDGARDAHLHSRSLLQSKIGPPPWRAARKNYSSRECLTRSRSSARLPLFHLSKLPTR